MRRGLPLVVGMTTAGLVACGALVGLGDRPTERADGGSDAEPFDFDATNTTDGTSALNAINTADAPDPTYPDGGHLFPASCLEILETNRSAESGMYTLEDDGIFETFCDMVTGGGGWTAFFAGSLGASNVIGFFDYARADFCPLAESKCLRRVPSDLPSTTRFAAVCGTDAIAFDSSPLLVGYFRGSSQIGWLPLANLEILRGAPVLADATYFFGGWGGVPGSPYLGQTGWIISSDDLSSPDIPSSSMPTPQTFASSYDVAPNGWDFCNGVDFNGAGATGYTPRVVLMYR